ncbi:MAG: site-specific integrase [Burkholderiales bacterium]|nr:site-specific integrase [Burkholderiales bacterium]
MAAIRKRGPHQWEAQIRRRGFPPQSKTLNTKAEAEAWAQMIESEMARGVWLSRGEAEATTLSDALDRYEREITPGKKSAVGEKSFLRIWRATPMSKSLMAAIRSADVAKLRDQWLKEYEPSTVLRRLAVLSHVFTIARKEWGMESLSNPVELVRKPRANDARTRRIAVNVSPASSGEFGDDDCQRNANDGELALVVAATESTLLPSIVWLAVETAMRRSEIIGLRWEHVDLARRVAHLPATKNGSSRDVPLSTRALNIFKALQEVEDDEAESEEDSTSKVDENSAEDEGRVFGIRNDAVSRAFERAVTRARKVYLSNCKKSRHKPDPRYLTDLRFHDLRHEATSRLAEIFPLHELTKITGHKDPRMLMRYYHPRAEDLAKRLA